MTKKVLTKQKKDTEFAKEIKLLKDSPQKSGAVAVIDFLESIFARGNDEFIDHYCIRKEDWETVKLLLK